MSDKYIVEPYKSISEFKWQVVDLHNLIKMDVFSLEDTAKDYAYLMNWAHKRRLEDKSEEKYEHENNPRFDVGGWRKIPFEAYGDHFDCYLSHKIVRLTPKGHPNSFYLIDNGSPFEFNELNEIRAVVMNNRLTLAHPNHPPHYIERNKYKQWEFAVYAMDVLKKHEEHEIYGRSKGMEAVKEELKHFHMAWEAHGIKESNKEPECKCKHPSMHDHDCLYLIDRENKRKQGLL